MLETPTRRPFWRGALLQVWTVIGTVVVGGVWGLYTWDDQTNQPWLEANTFFRSISRYGPHVAYMRAAPQFRAAIDEPAFERLVIATDLDDVKGGGFNDRDFRSQTADMGGDLYRRSGGKIPVVVRLSREPWRWKVTGFEVPGAPRIGPPPLTVKSLAARGEAYSPAPSATAARPALALPSPPRPDDRSVADPGAIVIAHPPRLGAT